MVVGQSDVVFGCSMWSVSRRKYDFDVQEKLRNILTPSAKRQNQLVWDIFSLCLAYAISGIVNDAVLNETRNLNRFLMNV